MTRILFICHGNICRSTMAQFVMTDLVNRAGLSDQFIIDSKATSREELGNPPHRGTVTKLRQEGVPILKHFASQMTASDYDKFDMIIGMDELNYRNIMYIIKKDPEQKVSLLLDYTSRPGDIADPWYTGNFDQTYIDVAEGCKCLLLKLTEEAGKFRQR